MAAGCSVELALFVVEGREFCSEPGVLHPAKILSTINAAIFFIINQLLLDFTFHFNIGFMRHTSYLETISFAYLL